MGLKGQKIGIYAPQFKDISETWEKIETMLKPVTQKLDKKDHRLHLFGGGLIEFWSLLNISKQDSGRGRDYDIVIYEETQSIPTEVLQYNFENVARATLLDRKGQAWFFGTAPNNRRHYFYKLAQRGIGNNPDKASSDLPATTAHPDYITFRFTSYDNPHVEPSEIDSIRTELPEPIFLQEYLAVCIEYEEGRWVMVKDSKLNEIFSQSFPLDTSQPLWLSFDFNKTPMSCTAWQIYGQHEAIICVKEFGIEAKGTIYDTLNQIKLWLYQNTGFETPVMPCFITGDATGNTTDPRQKKGVTFYEIIAEELGLDRFSVKVPRANPPHSESFLQVNTWLSLHPAIRISPECTRLKTDMLSTKATADRGIDKAHYDPHFLDTLRYFFEAAIPRKYKP